MNTADVQKILIFDTETTGKANFKLPGNDPSQPMPVQLGMLMYYMAPDMEFCLDNARETHRVNVVIEQPVKIQEGAYNVHGISQEYAANTGVSMEAAMFLFDDMASKADIIVAHNMNFDIRVIERLYVEAGHHAELWHDIKNIERFCTMLTTTPMLQLKKPNGWNGHKWPSLEECMQAFFDETIEGAHDALVDVEACARVFFRIIHDLTRGV